jgi:hypothetical protein
MGLLQGNFSRWWLLLGLILLVAAGCAQTNTAKLALESSLPEFLDNMEPEVRQAYRYAIANHHELTKYPCYCGCVYINHVDNLGCYISEIAEDGSMTFEQHASGCGVCVDITLDVMRLKNQGWSSPQIRTYIDEHYSEAGPGTNTPLPTE